MWDPVEIYGLLGGLFGTLGLLLLFDAFHRGEIRVELLNRLRPHFVCSFQRRDMDPAHYYHIPFWRKCQLQMGDFI